MRVDRGIEHLQVIQTSIYLKLKQKSPIILGKWICVGKDAWYIWSWMPLKKWQYGALITSSLHHRPCTRNQPASSRNTLCTLCIGYHISNSIWTRLGISRNPSFITNQQAQPGIAWHSYPSGPHLASIFTAGDSWVYGVNGLESLHENGTSKVARAHQVLGTEEECAMCSSKHINWCRNM